MHTCSCTYSEVVEVTIEIRIHAYTYIVAACLFIAHPFITHMTILDDGNCLYPMTRTIWYAGIPPFWPLTTSFMRDPVNEMLKGWLHFSALALLLCFPLWILLETKEFSTFLRYCPILLNNVTLHYPIKKCLK